MSEIEEQNAELLWLNKAFIETVLRHKRNDSGLTVTHVDVQNAVPKGDNYGSIIMRVATKYISRNGRSQQTEACSLIVKSLPKGEFFQKFIKEINAFVCELHIYKVALPQIYKSLEYTEADTEHFAPNFYVTDRPDTIILEDLRPLGYKMMDRHVGLDLPHCVLALRTLAKLHATSIVLHAEDPKSMEYYKESFYIEENKKMIAMTFGEMFKPIAGKVKTWEGFERFSDKVSLVVTTVADKLVELAKNNDGALRVLCHGDFWINNLLFRYENGKAVTMKMVDFQLSRFASPALDILQFLNTSISQDILEEFRDHLIKEYHESLTDTLRHLGHHRRITLDDINKELDDKAYMSVIMSLMLYVTVLDPEDAVDFSSLAEENVGNTGKEAEGRNRASSDEIFRNAFQKRLLIFEEQKLI